MAIHVTWLGHSAFSLDIDGHPVLIDPFITGNPLATVEVDSLAAEVILLSHAHGDHSSDVVTIARHTGATLLSNVECANYLQGQGVQNAVGANTGGTVDMGFMRIKWTIAFHSSSFPDGTYGGMPNGFLIDADERTMYFAGDTAYFQDMAEIGAVGLDLAFLPIGDHFTMGIEDSIKAIKTLAPRVVIPMHYNTFPPIQQDVASWAERVNTETNATPIVLDPNGGYALD